MPLNFLISFQRNIFLVTCNHTESMKLTAPFILLTVSIGILYLLFCVPTTQAQSSLKLDDGKGAFASTVQQPLKIDDGKGAFASTVQQPLKLDDGKGAFATGRYPDPSQSTLLLDHF